MIEKKEEEFNIPATVVILLLKVFINVLDQMSIKYLVSRKWLKMADFALFFLFRFLAITCQNFL